METVSKPFTVQACQCSYPTYEEWKLGLSTINLSSPFFGSYPTYEEWKRERKKKKSEEGIVLILPMRNGNTHNVYR